MQYKSFVIKIMSIVLLFVLSIGSFNYYMDPMWTFSHEHKHNDIQTVIDERQQKTNHLHFQPLQYDTLLLGSSRSTYINQYDFKDMNVYNFSVSNMSVREYNSFLEYAKKERGKEFETVIIGLDFFKTSIKESSAKRTLDHYVSTVNEPFYRFKSLLSFDLLEYSWENFKMSREGKIIEDRNYNRENVASAKEIDSELMKKQTDAKIQKFREVFYGKTYAYNPEYKSILMELKKNNPNTNFIIYTTPISSPLFEALVEEGRLSDYEQWLTDVVDVFGGVYNFMYPNTVTNNLSNYFDGHHFYPQVGTLIAQRITDETNPSLPQDFGQFVDQKKLASHLDKIRKESKTLVTKK